MGEMTVTLRCDPAPFCAAMDRLSAAFAEAGECLSEFGGAVVDLLEGSSELVRVEVDGLAASAAGEITVTLYPSESLDVLMATLGAGDVE
jgi:hypothetical protein